MITLQNVTKKYWVNGKTHSIFENLNVTFEKGGRYGFMGRNGTRKSSLISMITGTSSPTSGKIITNAKIS